MNLSAVSPISNGPGQNANRPREEIKYERIEAPIVTNVSGLYDRSNIYSSSHPFSGANPTRPTTNSVAINFENPPFKEKPVKAYCNRCKSQSFTKTRNVKGVLYWIVLVLSILSVLPFIYVTCKIKKIEPRISDVSHYCSTCDTRYATYRRCC